MDNLVSKRIGEKFFFNGKYLFLEQKVTYIGLN